MDTSELYSLLREQEQHGGAYALVRVPASNQATLYTCDIEDVLEFRNIVELPEEEGFVCAPYATTSKTPIYFFKNVEVRNFVPETVSYEPPTEYPVLSDDYPVYEVSFERVQRLMRQGRAEKVVLSHKQPVYNKEQVSKVDMFLRAATLYPKAYVALVHHPVQGSWFCASPEMLVCYDENYMYSVALAGTTKSEDESEWSEKNLMEHEKVTQFMDELFSRMGFSYQRSKTSTVMAGPVKHLATHYVVAAKASEHLLRVLSELHPTPAVCGVPRDGARYVVKDCEPSSRRYYGGYLGYKGSKVGHFYVMLRCMFIERGLCYMYAGGGIMPNSQVSEEWREVCDKLITLRALLGAS